MKVEREIVDGESVVRVTVRHWSAACLFLMLWLAGWSVGCYVLIVELMKKPFSCETVLFPIPFFAAEIGAIFAILLIIFGRTVLTFRRTGATKFFGIGRVGIKKEFTFPATGEICTDEIVRTGGKHGPRTYHRLVVKTPTDVDRYWVGTTSKSDACVFTSKNPRATPYAAVITIIATGVGARPTRTRHGAPVRSAAIWKPSRKRGIRFTKRSVTTPPAMIARNAKRWCHSIVCDPACATDAPNFSVMNFGAQKR